MAKIADYLQMFGLVSAKRVNEVESQVRDLESRIGRAFEAGYYDGLESGEDEPPLGDIATFGYRRQTTRGLRDFTQLSHDQILETVWTLYQSNGIAKRALVVKRDHILGRNTRPIAPGDADLQEILDDFWRVNKLRKRIKKFVIDQSLFGELCLPVFIRKTDGRIKIGYIDPVDIDVVVTHPHNVLEQWLVILKSLDGKRRIYRIIREDEGVVNDENKVIEAKHPGKMIADTQADLEAWEIAILTANGLDGYTGSCFYFDKNNVSNQPRGYSDLLQSADPLDQHDEVLFSLGEREGMAGYFSWDVTLKATSKEDVQTRAGEIRRDPPAKKGQANVHNDQEIWEFNHPDLKQPGSISTADALKRHALEGLNQPPHWHGEDDTANRATAESADNPVLKSLEHEQDDVKDWIIQICEFVRDQAEIARLWQPKEIKSDTGKVIGHTGKIDVQMPEIAKRDLAKFGPLLAQVIQSLTVAHLDLQVITKETVGRTVAKILGELGIDYNSDEELEKAGAVGDIVKEAQEVATNQWLSDRMENNGR